MKKIIALLSVAAVLVCSCSQNDEVIGLAQKNAIGFNIYTSMTRAAQTDVTTDNLTSFQVTASGNATLYFDNVTFTKGASATYSTKWASTPLWYWPSYKLTFYAYNTPSAGYTFNRSSDNSTVEVKIPAAITSQEDLVAAYSAAQSAPTTSGDAVSLTFKHYMSQVAVVAANKNANYQVKVKQVKFANLADNGKYTFSTNTMVASSDCQNAESSVDFRSTALSTEVTLASSDASVMGTERWYLVPQTVTAWNQEDKKTNEDNGTYIALLVSIKSNGGTSKLFPADSGHEYAWMAVPFNNKLEQGKKYTIKLNFFSEAGGGAGYQDPEEELTGNTPTDGNPGNGNPIISVTNPILFGIQVNQWATDEATTITIDL